jgi:hypothetical protein
MLDRLLTHTTRPAHKCARHAGKCSAFTRSFLPRLSKIEPFPVGFAIRSPEGEELAAIHAAQLCIKLRRKLYRMQCAS